jgi:hypothetical protein
MARDRGTFAKQLREMEKKRKSQEKRARKKIKKEQDKEGPVDSDGSPSVAEAK